MKEIKFRHTTDADGNDIYTLWPEKVYGDGWAVGWCPELQRTMSVHPANIVEETERAKA